MRNILTHFFSVFCAIIFSLGIHATTATDSVDLFHNVYTTSFEEGLDIYWSVDYQAYEKLLEDNYSIVIAYNTKANASRNSNIKEWERVDNIPLQETHFTLEHLKGDEKYYFKIGVSNGEQEFWSDRYLSKTKRGWGLFRFMVLIGSLGMFIYGMKIMSEGIQKAAGRTLRNILGSLTSNTFKGALTGFGVTALIQSSSVTTVMTVSFVNAGVLTLLQATGIIMGANIGTTLTGWIINIFGFEVDLSAYILVLLAIGVPLMFVNKSKLKGIANAIIGFCLFFIGLEFLKGAVPTLGPDSALIHFFIDFKDIPFISTLLFVLLGTLLTVIIQASSAALALTMTLVAGGIMPFEVAAAICLGENVGTTITAQLAATVANVHAKRAAWIHTLFNLIGVVWVILLFPYFLEGIKLLMIYFGQGDPFENPKEYANTGIAIFHTAFNICNVLLLIWFAPQLVKLSEFIVKSKGGADEEFHLDYIGTGYMSSPDLSLLEAKKEIAKFGELTSRMSLFARSMLLEKVKKKQRKIAERISKYEDITDRVEVEIANYLNKLTESGLSNETASRIRGMNSIANNLERIGDIFYQISKAIERKEEEKIEFTKKQRHNLIEMFDLVDEAFRIMCENLNKHSADVHIEEAMLAERNINHKRDQLRREYLRTVSEDKDAHLQGGIIYNSIFSSLERVGDHIINVSEGIVGKV